MKQVFVGIPPSQSRPQTHISTWMIMVKCRLSLNLVFATRFQMILILSCLFCLFGCGCTGYFNAPTILLTYNYGIASNFSLKVLESEDGDCFDWKSLNPHLVSVDPIGECSREAVISVVASASERKITEVRATVKGKSGSPLKCNVITDTPHSIELLTVTEKMFVSGPPLLVTAIAKDKFGHIFTSINGLIFDWKFSTDENEGTDCVRLRPVPISNDHNFGLVKRGLGELGHEIILEAKNPGSFYLSSILKGRYLDLQTPNVRFEVSSDIKVRPSNSITLLKMASANIYLEDIEKEIKFVDDVILETEDSAILQVNKGSNEVRALEMGETKLTLTHENKKYPVDVKVAKPTHLRFRISGGDFTILEERTMYTIVIEICAEDESVVFPSDDIRIATHFPSSLFYVNYTSSNGTYHVVQALVPGKGFVKAELKGIIKEDGTFLKKDFEVSASIEIQVCQSLSITPPHLLLPLESSTTPLHEIRLMMSGGSGNYRLSLDNNSSATVHFKEDDKHVGYLNIFKGTQKIIVTATDSKNPNFIATSLILLRNVLDIEVYPVIVESQVGNEIMLPVSLLAYEDEEKKIIRKYDDCSKIQPSIEIVDKNVIALDESGPRVPAFGKGCLSLQFKCRHPGHSRVNVFYEQKSSGTAENTIHKTTTVLACFKTLKPVHPVRVAVLPLGSSMEIGFDGGPRKWQLFKSGFFEKLEVTNPETLNFTLINDPIRYNKDLSVFSVTCLKLGENTLTFLKGNEPSATNKHPAKEETTIKLICSEPYSVHLKLSKKAKSLKDNIVKVPFYGDKLFQVDIWLKDSKGRKLTNITKTLHIEFEVSDKSLAEPTPGGLTTYENAVNGYRKTTRDFQEFKMTGETGDLKITAKVKSYRKNVLENMGIQYDQFNEISESLDLKLVSLRDINAGLYSQDNDIQDDEEGTCAGDSCKS